MSTRSNPAVPDPLESIMQSTLPVFSKDGVHDQDGDPWLPDISGVLDANELPTGDYLDPDSFGPCPDEAPYPRDQVKIQQQSEKIAFWIFDTLCHSRFSASAHLQHGARATWRIAVTRSLDRSTALPAGEPLNKSSGEITRRSGRRAQKFFFPLLRST